ncbi:MAG: hypothetical protein QGG62_03845 [Candidatus Poseidoniaceae archaeon]|nr:hypothetical protein [Candidatus Poseidoniaceae archaeon]|tara:strand:+ start:124 stop:531 length:408 start_codon:yes stop_codon:yes gene_type:complete
MKLLWRYHKDALAIGLGLFFINVGILHFTDAEWFTPIVPDILPFSAEFWVIISGIPEVLCGVGLILPRTRIIAGKATVALLIVLYWANLNMWFNNISLDGITLSFWGHILRGLAQLGMIAIAAYLAEWIPEYGSK